MLQTIWLAVEDSYIIDFEALPLQMLFHAIMILIMFFVLGKLVFKPVLNILQKRREAIQSNIDSAETQKKEAQLLKEEYEAKLGGVMKEREDILAKTHKDALQKEAAIVEQAHGEANRIRERVQRDITQERDKMRDELKQETVQLASAMAEKLMQHSTTPEDQKRLLDQAVKEMEEADWRQ